MMPQAVSPGPYGIIEKHCAELCAEIPGVRAARDIEYLHRMRVASRRLRTSLWVYKALFPSAKALRWKTSLRSLARILGEARDLDVHAKFLKTILAHARGAGYKKGVARLYAMLLDERRRFQPRVIVALDTFERSATAQELRSYIRAHSADIPQKEKLRGMVSQRIRRRLDDFLSFAPCVYTPRKIRQLHRMRIAAKHLRYSLEASVSLYDKKIGRFIDAAYEIQHILGGVHDLDVWISMLARRRADATDASFIAALGLLREHCVRLRQDSYARLRRIWKEQEQEKTWKKLRVFLKGARAL